MFREVLQEVVDNTSGAVAALLMGFDGIPVERYIAGDGDMEIDAIGMEYSVILAQIRKAAESLEAGVAREVAVSAEKLTTVMRLVNDQYFVAVAIRPDGNFGKARFLLRTNAPKLARDLA